MNPRYRLPGDTPQLTAALHALTAAGMLPAGRIDPRAATAPCPRCGRATAVWPRWRPPTACTGCRAEWITHAS